MAAFLSGLVSGATGQKKKDSTPPSQKVASIKNVVPNLKRIGRKIGGAFGGKKAAGDSGDSQMASPPEYKHGGRVRRTGIAKVHKGEMVIPVKHSGRGRGRGRGRKRGGARR